MWCGRPGTTTPASRAMPQITNYHTHVKISMVSPELLRNSRNSSLLNLWVHIQLICVPENPGQTLRSAEMGWIRCCESPISLDDDQCAGSLYRYSLIVRRQTR